jgi:4-aminobutyrate aminotransferase / (S)-3-amino-2-methylpropionate transaminase / 5-aminovalerate transaminase
MGDVHPSAIKVELLEKIAEHSPIKDSRIILGLNGSDAVEAALKTAFLATGKPGVLSFGGGYHGLTYGALEPTERSFFRDPLAVQRGKFASHVPFGCPIAEVEAAIINSEMPVGCIIVEPIQGRAGINIPPDGWLGRLRELSTKLSVVLIFDEIFTGWGRTGKWFACEHDAVLPDLLCVGKAMGGGMPISACIGKKEIIEAAWKKSAGEAHHTYTFLGHPLTCAASLAAINAILSECLVERSRYMGGQFLVLLTEVGKRFPKIITDVRGRGLMIGLELCDPAKVWQAVLLGLKMGLILLPAGDRGETIEIIPPYIISHEQMEWATETLESIFVQIS